MARTIWKCLVGAAMGLGLAAGAAAQSADLSSAVKRDAWPVKGLQAPAEMVIDHWGVAHVFAGSERDAYFLQGYNAARDRLWQIDLWRKRGLGRLSESFGPAYVDQDRAARLFLYRGDMTKEWAAYSPDAKDIVEAFVAGVNAYVAETEAGTKPLPVEFSLTNSRPEPWEPRDVVRIRSHALVSNITSEVARARVACAAGIDADMLRRKLEPAPHTASIPKGLNPCDVPADVLSDYFLGTKSVAFDPLVGNVQKAAIDPDVQLASAIDSGLAEGSNNWVVAASRTTTGRPILANDPHRTLGAPSLRYVVALQAPGLNIIGAGEPALPGISIGHNDDIAFGLTIFGVDQEDLYVYETKPGDPSRYRYKGKWEAMTTTTETINVKGEAPRTVKLQFTRHGPVVASDPANKRAFAIRSVWGEPGLSGYFGSTGFLKAKTWDEFRAATRTWGAPPENLVYADVKGNIGWAPSARAPIRKAWDGLMPVPGDGRYEWQGFRKASELPSSYNPAEGWFASANEMNLPKGYPAEDRKIGFEWADRSRIDRIKEVLAADDKVSLADSMALQTDTVSSQSRRLVALLQGLTSDDAETSGALAVLQHWDSNETTDSAAAAIYEMWISRFLGKATVARVTPPAARSLVGSGNLEAVISYLEAPDGLLGSDPKAARKQILLESLAGAVAELKARLGPDMTAWTWGRLHHATFEPEIAVLAGEELKAQMTVGPLQVPGSSSTPRAQSYRGADFAVASGASVRMVMDVGAWDNSTFINTPGQSTDPFNAHYRDLFPLWAAGDYAPLPFSREAVNRNAEIVIAMTPAG
jgi:penicillin G amidase